MSDAEFLRWIHDRLHFVYHESPNLDYMQRLNKIVLRLESDDDEPPKGTQ